MNVIIITGASSGIGMEFALQVDRGFYNIDEIWLIARRKKRLKELASVMRHETKIIAMDLTDEYAMDDFEKLLYETDCTVRMLINSAGYGLMGAVEDLDLEEQLGMLTTNCEGLTRLTYLCLPYMRRNSRILNLASSAGFVPRAGFAVYAATKSYVLSFSRALHEELRYRGIYVTAVCPGPVDTEFFETADQYGADLGINRRFMADPEPVVEQALRDSYRKKDISVYGLPVKAFHVLTRLIPHRVILAVTRYID